MKKTVFVILIVTIFVFPLTILILYTFSPGWSYPEFFPHEWNLRSYRYVAHQYRNIGLSLISSCTYSIITVLCAFGISLFPASVFARREFKGKKMLESISLAPALVPAITFSVGIHFLFIKIGVSDNMIGIVLVLTIFSYPYMLRSLIAGFIAYGEEYEICAKNLGAGVFMRIVRVDLPLLLPSIVAGGTVVFLVAFSEYFLVFLIGGGTVPSYTGYLFPFLNSSDRSIASLLTLIFMVIPITLFFIIDRATGFVYRKKGMA